MSNLDFDCAPLDKNLLLNKNTAADHYLLIHSETNFQTSILDRLWVLAQRYSILLRGIPTKLDIPSEASCQSENEIKAEFFSKLRLLEDSNSKLAVSLSNLRSTFNALKCLLREIGPDNFPTLKKNDIQPAVASCIEIFEDFLKYSKKLQSNLNGFAILLRPDSVTSVERYRGILRPNSEFDDYFSQCLATLHILNKNTPQ